MAGAPLEALFGLLLLLRFLYPFYMHPMRKIANDWGRHLDNGVFFFSLPTFMGGVDPKLYQLWLYGLNALSGGNAYVFAAGTGLLAAAMPYVWYKAAGEVFRPKTALLIGIAIAACPSFITIYSFFMSETLLLVTFGLALWKTLRAARKKNLPSFNMAVLCWVLALHSRMVVLPVAVLAVVWLFYYQKEKLRAAGCAAAIVLLITIPAAIQSYRSLHIYVPFQFTTLNEIYYKSGATTHSYDIIGNPFGGRIAWTSPSFFENPLDPLLPFHTARRTASNHSVIDVTQGSRDWDAALAQAEANYTWTMFFHNLYENAVYFVFGSSWPDSAKQTPYMLARLNYHLRWLFSALLLYTLAVAPSVRTDEKKAFLLLAAWVMIVSLLVQWMGVMEGRYRKPLEPLLIVCLCIMGPPWRKARDGEYSPYRFAMAFAVEPCLRWLGEHTRGVRAWAEEIRRSAPPDQYPW